MKNVSNSSKRIPNDRSSSDGDILTYNTYKNFNLCHTYVIYILMSSGICLDPTAEQTRNGSDKWSKQQLLLL